MFLTPEDIKILSNEINETCKNGLIQKISLIFPSGLQLTVRVRKSTRRIILFDSPHFPSIVVSKEGWGFLSRENPQFLQVLKKHIKGKKIINIDQLGHDRIVAISFDEGSLITECIERFVNIILLDSNNKISASHLPLRSPLRFHEIYSPPPALEKSGLITIKESAHPSQEVLSRIKNQIQKQGKSGALKRINKDIKKKGELIENLNRDLEEARNCERFKREGDLLKRVVGTIPMRVASVEVVDYESYPPKQVTIKIDPNIHPRQYVENLFSKYKKLKKSEAVISDRLDILKAEVKKLLIKREEIESEELTPAIEFQEKKKKKRKTEVSGLRTFHSSDGFTIFVARNVEQGEKLVRQAKSNDMWLHVLNAPGPHVIIQRMGRKPFPRRTMVEAAALAIYFSSIRKQGKGDATVAERRYIRFVKGFAGKVTYSRSETISVKIDEEKLRPILSSS